MLGSYDLDYLITKLTYARPEREPRVGHGKPPNRPLRYNIVNIRWSFVSADLTHLKSLVIVSNLLETFFVLFIFPIFSTVIVFGSLIYIFFGLDCNLLFW